MISKIKKVKKNQLQYIRYPMNVVKMKLKLYVNSSLEKFYDTNKNNRRRKKLNTKL